MELRPGDIFCTSFPGTLNRIILKHEKRQSKDNQAEMGHAGIILDSSGTTLEALWHIRHQNLWKAYSKEGCKLLIGRRDGMTKKKFMKGLNAVKGHIGKIYPFWRLPLHMIPGLAKRVSVGPAVCSELVMKFLVGAGLEGFWKGINPDDVADMIVRWKSYDVIYHQNVTTYKSEYLDAGGER